MLVLTTVTLFMEPSHCIEPQLTHLLYNDNVLRKYCYQLFEAMLFLKPLVIVVAAISDLTYIVHRVKLITIQP